MLGKILCFQGFIKSRDYFANKGPASQSYGSSSRHVWMWELDYKESWALKNWCFRTVVLEKTLESPLDWKEIQLVHPKGNQSWIFIGRTDAEAPTLGPPDIKSWLIGKDPDAGQDWRQEKETPESDMVAWHHQLDRHEFEQAPGFDDVQGSLVSCMNGVTKSWKQLSCWTELNSEAAQLLHLNLPIILFVLSHKEYHQFMNWFCYLEKIPRFTF